ncbi:MAG: hypothetical protein J6P57_00525 [Lachnospiraceae bacterium]|nr:hypothetical protein [Lachnospiraceae bacterium]
MNENEKYKSIFNAIENDTEITVDSLVARRHDKKMGKVKKAVCCFGAFAVLFLGSNVASYAKTGEFWIESAFNFKTASGAKVTIEEEQPDDDTIISKVKIETYGDEKDFYEVDDGRIYFTFDGDREDITDKCSDDSYYKHEYIDEEGLRHILIVGGNADNAGSAEYILDENGALVFSDVSGAVPLGDIGMVSQSISVYSDEDGFSVSTEESFNELVDEVSEYVYSENDIEDIMENAPKWLNNAEEELGIIY